jgi:hypothetical protein
MQDSKPIVFYLQKRNTVQKWYRTTEREHELLSSIETCMEYKNILLGYHYPIIVFTENEYNNFKGLIASDHVSRWLLLLEENALTLNTSQERKMCILLLVIYPVLTLIALTFLSGSENSSNISNIKWIIPIHTTLIFKEQTKLKDIVLREKGLA